MATTHSVQLLGIHKTPTTYLAFANSVVEKFHRQLKSALKAQPHPEHWTSPLPIMLLGIRTDIKDDMTRSVLVLNLFMELPMLTRSLFRFIHITFHNRSKCLCHDSEVDNSEASCHSSYLSAGHLCEPFIVF